MSYTAAGPGSAMLDRLGGVPHDGRWRSTAEMSDLLKYPNGRADVLRVLEAGGAVEARLCECGGATYWRRTDA